MLPDYPPYNNLNADILYSSNPPSILALSVFLATMGEVGRICSRPIQSCFQCTSIIMTLIVPLRS
ncbi:hypothetical protein PM082_019356 [Marasmius tenuissimus]|nr:hypothetical protein PM082_019356 [Marasmius tenuissimus]